MRQTVTASMPMALINQDADAGLVERYLAGDMTAFDELMIRYERQIYRVCYRLVENREDAMDLAQEVFIKAFEHLPGFRRESSLKTWLYRIANEQRHHFRRMVKYLPPKQKAILELRIYEQLSYEEIARISGRSVSTIKASVFFALAKLRKLVTVGAVYDRPRTSGKDNRRS